MFRLAFILLTLSLSLTGQEKPSPRTPEAIPWHSLATGLPPATISGSPARQRASSSRAPPHRATCPLNLTCALRIQRTRE